MATFSACLGIIALYYAVYVAATLLLQKPSNNERKIHLTIWTLVPPTFFALEWFVLFPKFGWHIKEAVELFEKGQSTARDFWAGFVALFGALHIAETLKPETADNPSQPVATPPVERQPT